MIRGTARETIDIFTGSTTITDEMEDVFGDSASDITLTLPPVAEVPHRAYNFGNLNTGELTIDGDGSETIEGATSVILYPRNASFERYFMAFDSAGGLDITTIATLQFATQLVADPPFSYATGTGILTINRTGKYEIGFDIGCDITVGSDRSIAEAFLEVDPLGVGSFAEVSGTRTNSYDRLLAAGEGHGTVLPFWLDLNATDEVRVRALRIVGTNTVVTKIDNSRFKAKFIGEAKENIRLYADAANSQWKILGAL